jgi:2-dehydro-3-deoxyphosphogluconate aldolase/(4S)-4-hydroxy-2-oxoglutarate aldolase
MAQFDRLTVYKTLLEDGMMPLFYNSDIEIAQQIVAVLAKGGSRLVEFTNRGDYAIEAFSTLSKYCTANHPDVIIGVGSVEDAATAALYAAHGANFIVGPNWVEDIARFCNRRKLPYIPGCGTVNEIARAEEWGAEIVKAFPGKAVGGADFVKAIRDPRPWTRIMPTGGVTPSEENLREWFEAGVACVGMGSNLVRKDWLTAGEFDKIASLTSETLALIKQIRNS